MCCLDQLFKFSSGSAVVVTDANATLGCIRQRMLHKPKDTVLLPPLEQCSDLVTVKKGQVKLQRAWLGAGVVVNGTGRLVHEENLNKVWLTSGERMIQR